MANKVNIDVIEVLTYTGQTAPAFIGALPTRSFTNLDGQFVGGGNIFTIDKSWVVKVPVTADGSIAGKYNSQPFSGAKALSATRWNGVDQEVFWNFYLLDANSNVLETLFLNIAIPNTVETITIEEAERLSRARYFPRRTTYPSFDDIYAMFDGFSLAPDASSLVKGKTLLDTAPESLTAPVAVGVNNPVFLAVQKSVYLEQYDSLTDALTEIDTARAELKITENVNIASNTTIPANVLVSIEGEGSFTVDSGQTLTISAFRNCGNRRVFFGSGKVVLAKNAAPFFDITWWAGTANSGNTQNAFECAVASLTLNGGGELRVPAGVWQMAGGLTLPNSTIVRGVGVLSDSGSASVVQLRDAATGTNIFNVGRNFRNIKLENLVLDCGNAADCIGFECVGEEPDSGFGLTFDTVVFSKGLFGMSITADDNSWEVINVKFKDCMFLGQTVANYRCQTVNNSTVFDTCLFQATNGVDCLKLESSGKLTAIGTTFLGINAPCVGGELDDSVMAGKVCHITGQQVGITFIGCQDEGFLRFIVNEVSDITYPINLLGNIIQAKMELLQSCVIVSQGNRYHADSWIVDENATVYVSSEFDHIRPLNLCNDAQSQVLADFSDTGTIFASENSYDHTLITKRFPVRFLSPKALDGNASTPQVSIGHYTEISEDKILLRLGRTDIEGVFDFYYDFWRDFSSGRLTINGNQTATPGAVGIDFNGDINAVKFRVGEVSPVQITSDQNNWNPGSSAQHILVTTDASRTISGMTFDFSQAGGDVRIIQNTGANNLVLSHQDTNSASGNRFLSVTGANLTVLPNNFAICLYDGTARRWRTFATSLTLTSVTDITATAAEINGLTDVSAYQETLSAAGAVSVTKLYTKLALSGTGAVTLAVPDASLLGQVKTIEMTADNGDVTLALTNIEGQSSGTTCTFNDVGDKLILVAGTNKWTVIKEMGVAMS